MRDIDKIAKVLQAGTALTCLLCAERMNVSPELCVLYAEPVTISQSGEVSFTITKPYVVCTCEYVVCTCDNCGNLKLFDAQTLLAKLAK